MATIIVKTATEFRDAHVTIEIRADQDEVPGISRRLTSPLSGRLYTAEEVGDAQAGEAEMIATPLRRRITELERMLVASKDRESKLESERDALLLKGEADRAADHDLVIAARAERDALLLKVQGYDNDRHTEKQRADENQGRLTTSRTLLESAQQDLNDAKASLTRIQGKVWKDTLDFAMNHRGAPEEIPIETVGDLANAVSAVRSIVGQP